MAPLRGAIDRVDARARILKRPCCSSRRAIKWIETDPLRALLIPVVRQYMIQLIEPDVNPESRVL